MQIDQEILEKAPPTLRTTLRRLLLPSLRLLRAGPVAPDSTGTRFGGLPLLVPGAEWPRSQSFLAQLNCNEVNARLGSARLPPDAVLAFFYDVTEQRWGFDPADAGHWRVVATPIAGARPLTGPVAPYPARVATATTVDTLPDRWDPPLEAPAARSWAEQRPALDAIYDVLEELEEDERVVRHRVFGWPEVIQNPMRLECQITSSGGTLDGAHDPRMAAHQDSAADWILLLQLDTDPDAGWTWGDAGRLYFWIRHQDLAAANFDRVWVILQCY